MLTPSVLMGVTNKNSIPPLLVSRKDAARALAISTRALDYLIAEGRLKPKRIGGRVLLPYSALQRLADSGDREPIVPVAA